MQLSSHYKTFWLIYYQEIRGETLYFLYSNFLFIILPQRDPPMNPLSEAFEKCNKKMKKKHKKTWLLYIVQAPNKSFYPEKTESPLVKNV